MLVPRRAARSGTAKKGRVAVRLAVALILTMATGLVGLAGVDAAPVAPSSPIDGALGMKAGSSTRFTTAEQWLGKPIRWTVGIADRRSPSLMRQSVWGQVAAPGALYPQIAHRLDLVMTVPLNFIRANARTPEGQAAIRAALLETASGRWDADYAAVAQMLSKGGFPDAVIRLGHEMTCLCQPWSAVNNGDAYVAAFRRVHDVMARVEPRLRFEWNAAMIGFTAWGPGAYPGDSYVDVIGLDVYYEPWKGDKAPYGPDVWAKSYARVLTDHLNFAKSRGKPVSYAEWAVGAVDEPAFIADMHAWFRSLPTGGPGRLLYASYFNMSKAEYDLSNYPRTAATYRSLFGG